MSTHVRCDKILVIVLVLELNSGGDSTFDKVFTTIVSKENLSCKCCDSEAFVFCYARGVSFGDKIFSTCFEFLSPKGLPVWVFFQTLNVGFGVRSIGVCLLSVENGRRGLN